jgi:predicted amidohydrolase YtcJ
VPEDQIKDLKPLMTMVGGRIVYASGPYGALAPK